MLQAFRATAASAIGRPGADPPAFGLCPSHRREGGVTATLRRSLACAHFVCLALVAAALMGLPACGVRGLSFVQDERVDILRPDDRSKVRLPTTVDWTVEGFPVGVGAGSFGVFVDRAPQPSGKTIGWLFRGDRSCKGAAAKLCSTPGFLAQRSVYVTTETALTVQQVSPLGGSQAGRQLHEVTVVLLDRVGRRVGEGAWSVQFEVEGEK